MIKERPRPKNGTWKYFRYFVFWKTFLCPVSIHTMKFWWGRSSDHMPWVLRMRQPKCPVLFCFFPWDLKRPCFKLFSSTLCVFSFLRLSCLTYFPKNQAGSSKFEKNTHDLACNGNAAMKISCLELLWPRLPVSFVSQSATHGWLSEWLLWSTRTKSATQWCGDHPTMFLCSQWYSTTKSRLPRQGRKRPLDPGRSHWSGPWEVENLIGDSSTNQRMPPAKRRDENWMQRCF